MPTTFKTGQLYQLPVDRIMIGPQQVRHDPNDEDIIELAASIMEKGLLEPIGVTIDKDDRIQLLYGNRRLTAYKRLKKTLIPAIYTADAADQIKTYALIENLQRSQLSLSEECDAVAHLHGPEKLSPDQIAVRLSKTRSWVLRRLSLPTLPIDLQEPLFEGRLPIGQAEELASLEDAGARAFALGQVLQSNLSLSQTRSLVEAIKNTPTHSEAVEAGVNAYQELVDQGPPKIDCQSCHAIRHINELMVVRICREGCPPQTSRQEENENG